MICWWLNRRTTHPTNCERTSQKIGRRRRAIKTPVGGETVARHLGVANGEGTPRNPHEPRTVRLHRIPSFDCQHARSMDLLTGIAHQSSILLQNDFWSQEPLAALAHTTASHTHWDLQSQTRSTPITQTTQHSQCLETWYAPDEFIHVPTLKQTPCHSLNFPRGPKQAPFVHHPVPSPWRASSLSSITWIALTHVR